MCSSENKWKKLKSLATFNWKLHEILIHLMDKLRILCMAIFFCYSKNKLTSILEQLIFYVMIFLSLFYQYTLIQSYIIRIFVLKIRFYYNFKEIVDVYRTKESSWLQSRNVIVQKWQPFFTSLWVFWMCQFFASWEC